MPKSAFGNYLREKRLEKNLTLRMFCERYGFDTAYISRLENNKITPPSKQKLIVVAEALEIPRETKEWTTFFDLAYMARNEFPSDIAQGAREVITILPAFLRTKDGKRVSNEKVEKVIKFLESDCAE